MLGVGLRLAVASVLSVLPAFSGIVPGDRLAWSAPVSFKQPVAAGIVLLGRAPGSTFTTTIPGIAIDDTTATVSGTPTARSGLVTEHFAGGGNRNSLLFALDAGPRTAKVGTNYSTVHYPEDNTVFLDYLKGSEYTSGGGTYDVNGMPQPRSDGGEYNIVFPMDDGRTTPFPVRLITDGDFDFRVQSFSRPGQPPTPGDTHFTKSGDDYVATWAQISGASADHHLFIGAVRKAPTYMAIVREEDVPAWRAYHAGTRAHCFKDSYIADVSRFSRIRFMDAAATNEADLPTPLPNRNSLSYVKYLPPSVQADLCIAARVDWWQNVHCKATDDDYKVTWPEQARVKAAGQQVCVEWSNEVWNFRFAQQGYAFGQFDKVPGTKVVNGPNAGQLMDSDPTGLTIDNEYTKQMWYAGYRAGQLAKLDRGRGNQWCIGGQTGNQNPSYGPHRYLDVGLRAAGGTYDDFTFWMVSTYTSGSFGQVANAARVAVQQAWAAAGDVDAGLDDMMNYVADQSHSAAYTASHYWYDGKLNADARGLLLIGYEGHSAVAENGEYDNSSDPGQYNSLREFIYTMKMSPLSIPVAQATCQVAAEAGLTEFMQFDWNSNGIYNTRGSPVYDGLLAYLAQPYVPRPDFLNTPGSSTRPANQITGAAARLNRRDTRLIKLGV